MEKSQIPRRQLIKARKNAPELLDLVDKTLDQMPFAVQPRVVLTADFRALVRRDHRLPTLLDDPIDERLPGITAIGNDVLTHQPLQQRLGLDTVVTLACGQRQPQRIAQPVHNDMDFGTQATSTPTQGLLYLAARFLGRQRRTDERAQWCYPASRAPCQDRPPTTRTSAPTPLLHTSEQSVCRRYSTCHSVWAASAIAPRCARPTVPLRQTVGTSAPTRLSPADTPTGRCGFASTLVRSALRLSCG